MKSVSTLTAATILVAIATSLRAEPQPPAVETVWHSLTVDLRDGSRLLGRPVDFEALPLDTSTGKLKIPLVQIKSFEMKDDKESAMVELRDGGRVSGTVDWIGFPLQTSIGKLNVRLAEVASCRVDVATVAAGNVALASGGATVSGQFLAGWLGSALIDGNTTDYDGQKGFAASKLPSSWVVTLPRTYLLGEIRLLLWDGDDRFYRYVVETSLDGKTYRTAADGSQGQWQSWQKLIFEPRPARHIRLRGLYGSTGPYMHVVELEAYCKPIAQVEVWKSTFEANHGRIGRFIAEGAHGGGILFTLVGGQTAMEPRRGFYSLTSGHPNYQAMHNLLYKAAEKRWKIRVRTKDELDKHGDAMVVHVEVNFPADAPSPEVAGASLTAPPPFIEGQKTNVRRPHPTALWPVS